MNNKYIIGEKVYVYNETTNSWNKGKIKEFRIELESSGEKTINNSNNISPDYDYLNSNNKPVNNPVNKPVNNPVNNPVNKPVNKPSIMDGLMKFVLPANSENKQGSDPGTRRYNNILNKETGKVVISANNQRKNAHNSWVTAKTNNTKTLMVKNQQLNNKEGSDPVTRRYNNILNKETGKVVISANNQRKNAHNSWVTAKTNNTKTLMVKNQQLNNKEGSNPATRRYNNVFNMATGKVVTSANNQRMKAHNSWVNAKTRKARNN